MSNLEHIKGLTRIGIEPQSLYGKGYRDAMATVRQLIEMIETVQGEADQNIEELTSAQ